MSQSTGASEQLPTAAVKLKPLKPKQRAERSQNALRGAGQSGDHSVFDLVYIKIWVTAASTCVK